MRLQEISEVPVLLSVMTMALMHSNQMPSSLFELYATWLPEFPRVSEPKWNLSCRPRVLQGHGSAKHFGKSAGQARRGPQGSNVATHAAGGAAQPAESETWLDRALALPIAVPIAAIGSCSMPLRRDPTKEAHLHPERCGDGLGQKREFLPTWTKFVERGDVPFVKILADGEDAEYQFRRTLRESQLHF